MDFERLERAWNGPANTPSDAANAYVTEAMFDALRERRRTSVRFLRFIAILMTAWTALIVFRAAVDPFPFDLSREWSLLPLIALPWLGVFVLGRQQRRHLTAHPDPYRSVAATLRALLDENLTTRRRLVVAAGLMAGGFALLALALSQLIAVGKMTPANAVQGAALFGGIMAVIAAYKTWHYLRVLRPEAERLTRLLAEYAS